MKPIWLAEYVRTPEARERARQLGLSRRTHGASRPGGPLYETYRSWQAMKRRCDNPKDSFYRRYGGRGITYDPRWSRFEAFLADMGERPEGMTLDRIDNDGNYGPDNCRWSTRTEQRRNRPQPSGWKQRPLVRPKVYGTKPIACRRCGISGEVSSVARVWSCLECRKASAREATARHRAKIRSV